jgi:hypothetical protein
MAFGRKLLLQASTFPSSHPIDAAGARNRSTGTPMPTPYAYPLPVLRQRLIHMHLPTAKVRDWRPGSRPGLSVSTISDEWTLAVCRSGLDAARGATAKWKRLAKRGTHAFAGPLNCSMSFKSRVVF